jgi:short-subunit dehydrogenase
MKSAILIGASSGIGRALAVTLSLDSYRVGVVARRTDLLALLRAELTGPCVIKRQKRSVGPTRRRDNAG